LQGSYNFHFSSSQFFPPHPKIYQLPRLVYLTLDQVMTAGEQLFVVSNTDTGVSARFHGFEEDA